MLLINFILKSKIEYFKLSIIPYVGSSESQRLRIILVGLIAQHTTSPCRLLFASCFLLLAAALFAIESCWLLVTSASAASERFCSTTTRGVKLPPSRNIIRCQLQIIQESRRAEGSLITTMLRISALLLCHSLAIVAVYSLLGLSSLKRTHLTNCNAQAAHIRLLLHS